MKILVAFESFFNFINSREVGSYIKKELQEDTVQMLPVIDGGEGSVEVLKQALDARYEYANVRGPKGDVVTARYAVKGEFCVMEMAEACGLNLVDPDERDILNSTSMGLGEMISDSLNKGARDFIIGVGDSATNDLGIGMLYSLGARFLDKNGNSLRPLAKNLGFIEDIDLNGLDKRIFDSTIRVACNIDNPLLGENGAAKRAKIKGASKKEIEFLEESAIKFTDMVERKLMYSTKNFPQAGAGGGVGYAFLTFLNASIQRSIDLILEIVDFKTLIKDIDLVIIGEKLDDFKDSPSLEIAKRAKKFKPDAKVVFIGEKIKEDFKKPLEIDSVFPISFFEIDSKKDKDFYLKSLSKLVRQIRNLVN
ncbi:MAG: glycerate kinase [Peptoniphilaceae bacterium]|nr:glycerate kinase [Peptoniphilaceae bacterium]MDD7383714.1 glycerate kinase [Peptoniphilaceae bacterium]MDY3737887.1 glycerate kinase [Peptoniphilaceae bacterium]